MEKIEEILEREAAKNPNVRFIIDNFDMLMTAHKHKTVLVMDERVVKVFKRVEDAFLYVDSLCLEGASYAIKQCVEPVERMLVVPNGK